jgi:hypothetical protein
MSTDDLHDRLRHLPAPRPPGLVARARLGAASQLPPSFPPTHRRRILEGLLAAAVAAAIAVPLYLTHSAVRTTGFSGTQLIFLSVPTAASPSAPCTVDVETAGGATPNALATISDAPGCTASSFGDTVIVTSESPSSSGSLLTVIDVSTGGQRVLPLQVLAGAGNAAWPSPDGTQLAIPVQPGPDGFANVDVVDLGTGSVVRQLEPRLGTAHLQLAGGGGVVGAWLADGLHLVTPCANFSTGASCEYLVNPVTGAASPLAGPTATSTPTSLTASPDGIQEAMSWCGGQAPYCAGGQTVTVETAGAPLRAVYAAPSATFAQPAAVSDDGSALIQVSGPSPTRPTHLVVAGEDGLHPVEAPVGWTLGGAFAVPGGGFAVEATRTMAVGQTQEEVLQVSDDGSSQLIAAPQPPSSSILELVGVAA